MSRLARQVRDTRPRPPEMAFNSFVPAPELGDWVKRTFIAEDGILANEAHAHLAEASIGWLWTDIANARHGRSIAGQCELMPPMAMGKWQRERAAFQMEQWFGFMPDFVITLHAPWCGFVDDASFCGLVEHELYHAGQERDEFGQPKFTRDGDPKFAIRGHDVEQFTGVVERYGAVAAGVEEMVAAAKRAPLIGAAQMAAACGTCAR